MKSELAKWLAKALANDAQNAPILALYFENAHNTLCRIHTDMACSLDFTNPSPLELRLWTLSRDYFHRLDAKRQRPDHQP